MSSPPASSPSGPAPENDQGSTMRSQAAHAPRPSTAQAPEPQAPPATPANNQSAGITCEAWDALVDRIMQNRLMFLRLKHSAANQLHCLQTQRCHRPPHHSHRRQNGNACCAVDWRSSANALRSSGQRCRIDSDAPTTQRVH